jgi:hypothetical protein
VQVNRCYSIGGCNASLQPRTGTGSFKTQQRCAISRSTLFPGEPGHWTATISHQQAEQPAGLKRPSIP